MTPDPIFLWRDLDRLLYKLELTAREKFISGKRVSPLSAVWYLRLACAIPKNSSDTNAEREDWAMTSKNNTVRKLKGKYEKYVAIIKEKGVDGLIQLRILKDNFKAGPQDEVRYYKWLTKKEKGEL